eukprot:CAMPEP_0119109838 /NCGR_PEP_ID=MMETSP1180-20130426/24011_1 /TAXON_ID=3052 ORGANISM="Chlamydomonas cf sp, Strain CCMP681" /NCGR_SAMPLE_ID=MMETSP1180 /ASSEMBLY_ACC=CAM_ASM_000741 /LENGTH=266 /DNA_ID=CAMNT_0007095837 /DNA_START=1 /DNA_END=801 /DNA_ORIENTATION=+
MASPEYEEEESEDQQDELGGSLKTQLVWLAGAKHMAVQLRQVVQTPRGAQIKYKVHLNTHTGEHMMKGHLLKSFHTNTFAVEKVYTAAKLQQLRQRLVGSSDSQHKKLLSQVSSQLRELDTDPDVFLPGGLRPLLFTDWLLAPGMTYDSGRGGSAGLRAALMIKKAPQVLIHAPKTDLMLTAKSVVEVDPRSNSKVSATASVRLQLFKAQVTSKQDLTVSVGLDLATTPLDVSSPYTVRRTPYLKVSENNCSVKLQRGAVSFLYSM